MNQLMVFRDTQQRNKAFEFSRAERAELLETFPGYLFPGPDKVTIVTKYHPELYYFLKEYPRLLPYPTREDKKYLRVRVQITPEELPIR